MKEVVQGSIDELTGKVSPSGTGNETTLSPQPDGVNVEENNDTVTVDAAADSQSSPSSPTPNGEFFFRSRSTQSQVVLYWFSTFSNPTQLPTLLHIDFRSGSASIRFNRIFSRMTFFYLSVSNPIRILIRSNLVRVESSANVK